MIYRYVITTPTNEYSFDADHLLEQDEIVQYLQTQNESSTLYSINCSFIEN